MEALTPQGITIQHYQAVPFDREILKSIDFEVFTPKRVHYLVNALVHNTKVPSEQAMIRSEKKNLQKSGADKADQVVGRMPRIRARPRRCYIVPDRYGRLPRPRRNANGRRGRGRAHRPINGLHPRSKPIDFSSLINHQINGLPVNIPLMGNNLQQPMNIPLYPHLALGPNGVLIQVGNPPILNIPFVPSSLDTAVQSEINIEHIPEDTSLSEQVKHNRALAAARYQQKLNKIEEIKKKIPEIVRKARAVVSAKEKSNAFRNHDPEWIALKAYKAEITQLIQKYREETKKDKEPMISENLKDPLPLYFQKKKANQKRRRQQKHELIKKNRKALVQIFGDAIFQRGWPISRKQIKAALGIEQQGTMAVQNVSEFMGMAQGSEIEPMSVENPSSEAQMMSQEQP